MYGVRMGLWYAWRDSVCVACSMGGVEWGCAEGCVFSLGGWCGMWSVCTVYGYVGCVVSGVLWGRGTQCVGGCSPQGQD